MSKLYLEIKADTNDSNYVTSRNEIDRELLEQFMPLIKAISDCKEQFNWNDNDGRREDEKSPREMYAQFGEEILDWFSDICPYGEYGIHTIVSIKLLEVVSEEDLL